MFVMSEVCKKNNHINNFDSSITPWTNEREKHSVSFIWNQRIFVYNSTVFRLTDLFVLYMPTKISQFMKYSFVRAQVKVLNYTNLV